MCGEGLLHSNTFKKLQKEKKDNLPRADGKESNPFERLLRELKTQADKGHKRKFLWIKVFGQASNEKKIETADQLESVMKGLLTSKQTQRVLTSTQPSPTMLTIPDDYVHPAEPRTLTVREMARLQSFPDRFEFVGKATTGGDNRKREVPQYTQVGNAVPPLLAKAIGLVLMETIERVRH